MLRLALSTAEIGTRLSVQEARPLPRNEFGVGHRKRACWDVHDGAVGFAGVNAIDGVDCVAVPAHVVAWVDTGHVDHAVGEVEVRVQEGPEFLAVAWCCAVEPGVGCRVQFPIT